MAHKLEAATFPLHGSRLIEASAGTGKTWTIAALYLRLVLGHGAEGQAFQRPLQPAEILVMTFTRAATQELSDRIRARLIEAARWFRGETGAEATPDTPPDPLLAGLLADYPDAETRRHAAWRLAMAAETMDDAAVFTIDAWCQRMLREHAFDSGNPFDEELAADERGLLTEAAQDYWRQQCYPLAGAQLDAVLAQWPGVEALVDDMRELVGQPLSADRPGETLAGCLTRVQGARNETLLALSQGWLARAQAMRQWLDRELAPKQCDWNRQKLQSRHYDAWFLKLEAWARDPLGTPLDLSDSARHRLSPDGLLEARKPGAATIELPADFADFAALIAALDALPELQEALRVHAATRVGERLAVLKRQARSFGFADMLARLDRALSGPHGARLRARILEQYPVALIDEFQDTSPLQFRLFDALYRSADNDPAHALLLIGDPKQSIYGFRGADIYSYLRARHATTGRHYMLDTNYRSTAALVRVVNQWFTRAEDRPDEHPAGGGAFLFRSAQGNDLPFAPVQAQGRKESFHCSAGAVPALTVHHDLDLRSSGDSRRLFAARCAERIVTWLNDASAGFRSPDGLLQRLRPADIAVLVRTGKEAAAVRRALRERGVSSVYLSDKDSVFASQEARDLLHWLRAVASPLDARRVRAALATRTVGLSVAELGWLASDDEAFDVRSEQMRALHAVWRELGVLTMLRRSLHLLDLPARWLAEPDGERRLTNFLHLAELLQHAGAGLDGEQALVRWLALQIEAGSEGREEQVVRLESDADLVKVVTVHKSKGLEYPVVCLPFACGFRKVERRYTRYLKLADVPGEANGERPVKLRFDDDDLARAEHERLREDLRLFYVALTRARHALWMGFAALKIGNGKDCQTHLGAPGYLLGGPALRAAGEWLAPLQALAAQAAPPATPPADVPDIVPDIVLEAAREDIGCTPLQRREALPALQDSPAYAGQFERRWALGSFSALVRDLATAPLPAVTTPVAAPDEGIGEAALAGPFSPIRAHRPAADEAPEEDVPGLATGYATASNSAPNSAPTTDPHPWHRFPRGALAGDFLHDMLEWLAGEGFALAGNEALQAALRRRCERAGHGERAEQTLAWMQALLATPLPSLGAPLQQLHTQLSEMEFWMPAPHLQAGAIDALCRRHLLGDRPRPPLPQRELHGMLMGFCDLVFEHEGRYWVLDYKSNRLGEDGAAYDRTALEAAMAQHRYDVQAALYLLALHRLLRARLGEAYDPARQLGGALYFFLRGLDGPVRGEYAIAATPEVLTLLDTLDPLLTDEALPQ